MTYNNKLLVVDGKLATSSDCCDACDWCCSDTDIDYIELAFDGFVDCGSYGIGEALNDTSIVLSRLGLDPQSGQTDWQKKCGYSYGEYGVDDYYFYLYSDESGTITLTGQYNGGCEGWTSFGIFGGSTDTDDGLCLSIMPFDIDNESTISLCSGFFWPECRTYSGTATISKYTP